MGNSILKTLKLALSFLTIIPFPSIGVVSDKEMGHTIAFFPLVGLIVGAVNYAMFLFGLEFWSPAVAAWLWLISNALITGGLHLDGWIDTFDALGSRKSRSEMLMIMKDSRIGALGGIAAVLLLGFKWSLLTESNTDQVLVFLAPVVGRSAVLMGTQTFKYIREQGLGHAFTRPLPLALWLFALATILAAFFIFADLRDLLAATLALILAMLWARFLSGKFGGLTGDNYGAINELTEILFLFIALAGFVM